MFQLLDGSFIDCKDEASDDENTNALDIDDVDDEEKLFTPCRDTAKVFEDKQRIRHVIKNVSTIEGLYDKVSDSIIFNGINYTLNKFASMNYRIHRPDRTSKKKFSFRIDTFSIFR